MLIKIKTLSYIQYAGVNTNIVIVIVIVFGVNVPQTMTKLSFLHELSHLGSGIWQLVTSAAEQTNAQILTS